MSVTKIEIPGEDAWIIARLAQMLANRLVHGPDNLEVRRSLLRLLFGLQRLPILIPDLCLSLGSGRVYIEINSGLFGLVSFTDEGHTEFRLQYFDSSNHCLLWNDHLFGAEKRMSVEARLQELEGHLSESSCLSIEDRSSGDYVDEPPIDDYMEYSLSNEAS